MPKLAGSRRVDLFKRAGEAPSAGEANTLILNENEIIHLTAAI
jgi:hypothetical protein